MKKWNMPILSDLSLQLTAFGGNSIDPDGGVVKDIETNENLLQTKPGS